MQSRPAGPLCCGRCAGAQAAARVARRQRFRAAVFAKPGGRLSVPHTMVGAGRGAGDAAPFRTVTGTLLDISPHILVVATDAGERRLALTPRSAAWRGRPVAATELRPDEPVVIRLAPGRRDVADKIWASIGRVAGTISASDDSQLLVDEGTTRKRQAVVIAPAAANRIRVRFPQLEPGNLIDVIGLRRAGALEARIPGTSQPAYPVDRVPAPAMVAGHVPSTISGSATWHEPVEEPGGLLGVSYPAIDPEAGCAEDPVGSRSAPRFARMPYLAIGSLLLIRNDCTGDSCLLPVTGCAAIARLFNDRCVTCGTSPRGRVADLTQASFIALGGELERACFNATITIGG